jgi:hypothetical protein
METYTIIDTIGGINNHIDFSVFSQRLSVMSSLERIEIVPVPHRNVINFFGMRPKSEYMLWHHQKDLGEFTAVDNTGLLQKWSCATGKLIEETTILGKKRVVNKTDVFDFKNWSIYRGSTSDHVYMNGW